MSIKGFLEVQEMQEGGPAMFTPFAVDPEGSPRRRIAPTYQPNPPPTIVLDLLHLHLLQSNLIFLLILIIWDQLT